ncbi:MAG: tetratricopeptide repeat protein [Microgenomates group bacterium]|jgi:tetratricopeptide (TPR) repeat protein
MKKYLPLIIIIVVTIFAYINIFQNQFVIDDKTFIIAWEKGHSLSNIVEFFQGAVPSGHEGVYRPIRSILYAFYYSIWGTNPFGYHLHALLIHLISTALIYFILEIILKKKSLAFAGGLLFALHPIHTETIAYTVVSMEATGIVFFLISFYLYLFTRGPVAPVSHRPSSLSLRARRWEPSFAPPLALFGSYLFALLAFFTYEMTLTLPFLIILYDLCFTKNSIKKTWKKYLPYFILAGGFFLIRQIVTNGVGRGEYLNGSIFSTFLAGVKVLFEYLTLTILPINLTHNHIIPRGIEAILYRGHSLQPITSQSIFDWEFSLAFFTLIFLGFIIWKSFRKHPIITFGGCWFFITLIPVSNIIPQWSLMHEKFLYAPSFGLILVATYLLGKINNQFFYKAILVLVCGGFFVVTFLRVGDWKDAITLWQKDIQTNPNNAYAYFQLGEAYVSNGEIDKAIFSYQKAFDINPHFAVAIASKARTYQQIGDKEKAIENYKLAVKADPNFWEGKIILDNLTKQNYVSPLGFSFSYPFSWSVEERFKNLDLRIMNEDKSFEMVLLFDKNNKKSPEDYLKTQTESYGNLVNQGLAQIPDFDYAYVKVFKEGEVEKMLFYLFKGEKIIKILVYPVNTELMKQFDSIVTSLKFS